MDTQTAPQVILFTKPTDSVLSYCSYSNTIRQLPQNYCIAVLRGNAWHLDADLAAHPYFVALTSVRLLEFSNKYAPDGLQLLSNLTN